MRAYQYRDQSTVSLTGSFLVFSFCYELSAYMRKRPQIHTKQIGEWLKGDLLRSLEKELYVYKYFHRNVSENRAQFLQ